MQRRQGAREGRTRGTAGAQMRKDERRDLHGDLVTARKVADKHGPSSSKAVKQVEVGKESRGEKNAGESKSAAKASATSAAETGQVGQQAQRAA